MEMPTDNKKTVEFGTVSLVNFELQDDTDEEESWLPDSFAIAADDASTMPQSPERKAHTAGNT